MRSRGLTYFIIIVLFFSGCSTEKNTWITRTYHNVTSKYNILFNASESFNKGVKKVNEAYENDFTGILPVFTYGNKNIASTAIPDMERTLKKCSKVITFHSIKVKPEIKEGPMTPEEKEFYEKNEYNIFVDDAYMFTGKAHFYKHDFRLASETFKFVIREFENQDAMYTGLIWLARTNCELERYDDAEKALNILASQPSIPEKLKEDYFTSLADFYIKQEMYREAIPHLETALQHTRKKDNKIRYSFILAQLYAKIGEGLKAYHMYGNVIKFNPPYEFTFNAKINRASVFEAGVVNAKEIKVQLLDMLKDEKNKEFKDQIYYALGNIEIKENKIDEALEYYKLSTWNSVSNDRQKAKSYISIADIYYEFPDYKMAQFYYDSAVMIIDETHNNYQLISARAENLTNLVKNLNTIELQDSVQVLAKMGEEELYAYIDKVIENVKREEIEAKQRENERRMQEQMARMHDGQGYNTYNDPTASGKWYFYSPSSKNQGSSEFKRKWGDRELEDNWRRKSKKIVSTGEYGELAEEGDVNEEQQQKVLDNKSREFYLQNIPLTDSMMQVSHEQIRESIYNAGMIYWNDLGELDLAAEKFEELGRRYPENDHALMAFYNLYKIYNEQGNLNKSNLYKNLIINNFPESQYAKLLTNPNYLEELKAEKNRVYSFYEKTYNLFQQENYQQVIDNVNYAFEEFKESDILPKYAYLRAISIGKTNNNIEIFRDTLNKLINTYPGNEVADLAKAIINKMNVEHPEIKQKEEIVKAKEIYTGFDVIQNSPHFFVILLDSKQGNMNQLIFNIINFNLDVYENADLRVNGETFNKDFQIVTVKQFKNTNEAIEYYQNITSTGELFKDVGSDLHHQFIISEENMKVLRDDKGIERYMLFFKDNYLD
ncbi:MAG: tetratricopeptide repeat protein [Bacteroidota bacterium]